MPGYSVYRSNELAETLDLRRILCAFMDPCTLFVVLLSAALRKVCSSNRRKVEVGNHRPGKGEKVGNLYLLPFILYSMIPTSPDGFEMSVCTLTEHSD